MEKATSNTHDLFFRKVMSDIGIARDFFNNNLPQNILNRIDLHGLQRYPSSHIGDKLKEQISDNIYSVQSSPVQSSPVQSSPVQSSSSNNRKENHACTY